MTGFAGSRSLDERRRRRLATDAETVAFEAATEPAPRRLTPPKVKRRRRGPAHFPLRKVISIRYWKLAAVIFLATLAGAGALAGGWAAATHREQLGPGFVLFFRLDAARLIRGFAAVGLLLAGQLALLISWVRSQSLQDFNGRYRGWVVCAILAFLGTMALETQLTAAWSADGNLALAGSVLAQVDSVVARSDGPLRSVCACVSRSRDARLPPQPDFLMARVPAGWWHGGDYAGSTPPAPALGGTARRMRRRDAVCHLRLLESALSRAPRCVCLR